MTDQRLTLLRTLLAASLVAAVLIVIPGVPHAFETPKDAVLCLAAGAGLVIASVGPVPALPSGLVGPLLAFVAAGVASSAAAGLWTHVLVMDGAGVLLFLVGVAALGAPEARARLARVLVAVAAVEAAVAAAQLALGPAALHLLGRAPRRAYAFGTLGVANWVGALAALALPPALLAPSERRLDALPVALLGVGLAVSGSRGAWLAALATLPFIAARGTGRHAARAIAAGVLLGALAVAAMRAAAAHGAGSVAGRLLVWRAAVTMIAAHPVLGVGPGGFGGAYPAALHAVVTSPGAHPGLVETAFVTHAHDLVLTLMAERGVVGLLAFIWLAAAFVRLRRDRVVADWTPVAAAGTLIAFAVYGVVDHPLACTPLAMAAWLAAAALVAPDDARAAGRRAAAVRVGLAATGLAAATFGLLALRADRGLAAVWEAAGRGDDAAALAAAETVRLGPARDEAYEVRGLAALGMGDPAGALRYLGTAARTRADPDLYYASAAALARAGDLASGLERLAWLAATLPGLVGPHLVDAELRRAAGADGVDPALARAVAAARDTAPNPRLDVFMALAAARGRERAPADIHVPLVVVDPGHGGESPGARAGSDVVEKRLTLQLVKPLVAALRARGVQTILTRARDRSVPLDARARLANSFHPDLFVSVHVNAARDPARQGLELYVRETDPDAPPFPDLSARDRALFANVLPDGFARAVAARRTLEGCARDAARRLADRLASGGAPTPPVLPAPFYVLRQVQAPAVLVEAGYITNPVDARRLGRPSYRRTLATALADGAVHAVGARCRP